MLRRAEREGIVGKHKIGDGAHDNFEENVTRPRWEGVGDLAKRPADPERYGDLDVKREDSPVQTQGRSLLSFAIFMVESFLQSMGRADHGGGQDQCIRACVVI
jgi:hypothetical protein